MAHDITGHHNKEASELPQMTRTLNLDELYNTPEPAPEPDALDIPPFPSAQGSPPTDPGSDTEEDPEQKDALASHNLISGSLVGGTPVPDIPSSRSSLSTESEEDSGNESKNADTNGNDPKLSTADKEKARLLVRDRSVDEWMAFTLEDIKQALEHRYIPEKVLKEFNGGNCKMTLIEAIHRRDGAFGYHEMGFEEAIVWLYNERKELV